MLHVVLQVFARKNCLSLAGQYPSELYFAWCVVGICKKQLFVSSRSIPIRILCCMLCCGYLPIAVCLKPVNTHPNPMLHVVLWVFVRNICLLLAGQYPSEVQLHVVSRVFARNSCLFLAGQYPSEFYVACCVAGICKKQLFVSRRSILIRKFCAACCVVGICKKQLSVSSRSIPIRILCFMLCCGYLQDIAVCFQPVSTHPFFYFECCVVGICKKQLFVSSRSIPIRILCCMLCCGYLQIAVCLQPVNTHPNSMLHVVLWVFARNCCLFLAGQYPSEFYVACCVVGICKTQLFVSSRPIPIRLLCCVCVLRVFAKKSCLFLAGQYPSEFYVACCVVGICKKQLFVSSRSIPIRILCCMLCWGQLQEITVCFQPVNTHPNSMLHVVLWVFANSCLFLAGQYPSEFYVACCVVGICQEYLFASSRSIPIRILCCMLCCGYLQEIAVCL